jgi:hypothetical protein
LYAIIAYFYLEADSNIIDYAKGVFLAMGASLTYAIYVALYLSMLIIILKASSHYFTKLNNIKFCKVVANISLIELSLLIWIFFSSFVLLMMLIKQ